MSANASNKDSMKNILIVSLSVCFVCSVVVSLAAVMLKPQRIANKELDRNKSILIAAGLYQEGVNREEEIVGLFSRFTVKVADLEEGKLLSETQVQEAGLDLSRYDQRKAAKDNSLSRRLSDDEDLAQIGRRARYSVVYLIEEEDAIEKIVLPVHGYGLWSTLYGFMAVEGDGNTVSGITFYEHAETAGLGGEVDNPKWKALWQGKQIYDTEGGVALEVIKGKVDEESASARHKIDGLSGATLTSNGVKNLVAFWMGEKGFGPILKQI